MFHFTRSDRVAVSRRGSSPDTTVTVNELCAGLIFFLASPGDLAGHCEEPWHALVTWNPLQGGKQAFDRQGPNAP